MYRFYFQCTDNSPLIQVSEGMDFPVQFSGQEIGNRTRSTIAPRGVGMILYIVGPKS